jgi:virulence-associated protein VagC
MAGMALEVHPRHAAHRMTNRSQAVRLPKEYQFSTDEVFIRKEG